eukprot:TRINITY_DN23805_c0_g1_i1.p1 TRINITY_DN23805_c0_g1~~TRINITY_DN23805_c0_g1_i1.p1  ORF type:complete len:967 (+),score=312.83 TRINITY_DN23805_c0_g1_i1:65-2965(+)
MTDGQEADEQPQEAADKPEATVELKRGDLVTFDGLKVAELNGLQGHLFKLDEESGRWEVKMPDDEVKAIKPANLVFKGIGPIEDDGSLMLIGMASEHHTLQKALGNLSDLLGPASNALSLLGSVISPSGGRNAEGEGARIWLKLAKQAEQQVRGALEDLQKNVEMVDSISASAIGAKAAGELKLARRDLIQFVQKAQEQLEAGILRLRPVLKYLVSTVPALGKKHGWSDEGEQSLHDKYRAAFEKMEENAALSASKKARLATIIVKYQGRGDNPPPSDNLYVKGLPGWVTEEDVEAIFSQAGQVQSMKLKTADWGAIAFVRLANRSEAARAIAKFNCTVPDIIEKKAEEQEAMKLEGEIAKAALRATVDQLARGVIVIVDLKKPLGCVFNDFLTVKSVQENAQGYQLGMRKDWRVRSIGGIEITKTEELKERMASLKSQGMKQAALVCRPPPVVVSFSDRPFGFAVEKDPELGLIFVADSKGLAAAHDIRRGALVSTVGGTDISGMSPEEVTALLREAVLPVSVCFEQAQDVGSGAAGAVTVGDSDDEAALPAPVLRGPPVDLEVDLSQPLGIVFDDNLVAKSVKFGSQAARLGVAAGWKVVRLAGDDLVDTQDLLGKVQALKAEGCLSQALTFQPTAGSKAPAVTAQAAAAAMRQHAAAAAAEAAEKERQNTRRVELDLDLSQPLGILFNKSLLAESVTEGSQGARLGVAAGWRAVSLGGEEFANTKALVAKIQALKQEGSLSVSAVFAAPLEEEPAKVSTTPQEPPTPAVQKEPQTPAAQDVELELSLDLSQPLGIGFSDHLVAKDVKEGAQGASLGVCLGWRLLKAAGEAMSTSKELVARIKALKSEGTTSVVTLWSAPPGSEVKRPAAEEETRELDVDLSKPLGIGFTDDLVAKEVKTGMQAEQLGVGSGWKIREVAGEKLSTTKELVAKFGALKKGGTTSVRVLFVVPDGSEPAAKRQRTS